MAKQHKNPSQMLHKFSDVPVADIQRSSFNRSHSYKTTFDAGYIVPFFVDEALPGDTFNLNATIFARLNTPEVPFMDNLHLDTFYFAVPMRLVWDNFKKFMGEQIDPGDSIDYTIPQLVAPASGGFVVGKLGDYFGIPTGINSLSVNALPFRAYYRIWNEWFRDQNLQDSENAGLETGDGPTNLTNDYNLLRRGKRHDYFTSCLPWPQKGDAATISLGTTAPISGIGKFNQVYSTGGINVYETDGSGTTNYPAGFRTIGTTTDDAFTIQEDPNNTGYPNLRTDLSSATASTVNQLRESIATQHFLETDARAGTRYTEIVKAHFNVTSPDARLQRPEYLGGRSTPLMVTPVEQTSSTDATTPQGNLAGYGTALSVGEGFSKSFTEHCYVFGLLSVRADLTYQQGLNRMWSRSTRYDFYWPEFAHLGEQEVLNKEIYAQNDANDDLTFGYQERYAEYRYKPSQITGQLRSTYSTPLDYWHLAEEFGSLPTLSSSFIEDNPPVDRVVAITSEPDFVMDSFIDLKCARPMPVYSIPGLNKL